jgi:hypothetical protein
MADPLLPIDLSRAVAGLGPIVQLAWIVEDLDEALKPWVALGVGPFYVMRRLRQIDCFYYGKPVEIEMSAALGYWGDIQIELILQHNDAETIYSAWKRSGQAGPHHILIAAPDFAAAGIALAAAGGVVAQEATAVGMARVKYFDMGPSRPYIEIGEAFPEMIPRIMRMRDETANYDGTNPIRDLPMREIQGGPS